MSSSARKRKGARGCAGGAEYLLASAAFPDSTSEDRPRPPATTRTPPPSSFPDHADQTATTSIVGPRPDHDDQTLHGEVSSECFQALHGSLNDDHATEGPKATKNTPPTDEPRMKAPKITTPTEEPNLTTKTTTPTEEPRKTTNITTLSEWVMGMW